MSDWLAPVARALDTTDAPCRIFFGDDDAGWDDAALLALLDEFVDAGIAVDVAAIPQALSRHAGEELAARAAAGTVRVHQHGWAHVNHEPVGRKCEFGPARAGAVQVADVCAGRRRLEEQLERPIDPVFTPPWNRCTPATAHAVLAAGHRVLSRDHTAGALAHPGLIEVPVNVDWSASRKGRPVSAQARGEAIAEAVGVGGPVGVMLHHAVLDDVERREVRRLLDLVASAPGAAATTILGVATGDDGAGVAAT